MDQPKNHFRDRLPFEIQERVIKYVRYNRTFTPLPDIPISLETPHGVAFTSHSDPLQRNIWMTDPHSCRIQVSDHSGKYLRTFTLDCDMFPRGLFPCHKKNAMLVAEDYTILLVSTEDI